MSSEPLDKESFFPTQHLAGALRTRTLHGGTVTMVAQAVKFCAQMASTIILARLLMPADYGLVAMVAAVTEFISIFKDLGLATATIQRQDITRAQVSTLFWVNVFISLVIMLIAMALAPVISSFYHEPRLVAITVVSASTFVFGGLAVQHQALLKRQMRFLSLSVVDITALLISIGVGVTLALRHAGYWALVYMQIAGAVVSTAGYWIACGWRPGLPARKAGSRSMLAFGGNVTGFSMANYFARNFDNVLIGRYCGEAALGYYSRAYGLLLAPLSQISSPMSAVAVPALSCIQKDSERFSRYYLNAVRFLAFLTMPVVMFFIIMSKEIVRVMLGPKWLAVTPIFLALGFSALIQPVVSTAGWVHISIGRPDRLFRWGVFSSLLIVLSFVAGLPYGPVGVAAAYTVVSILIAPFNLWYAFRPTTITLGQFFETIRPVMAATVVLGVVAAYTKYLMKNDFPIFVEIPSVFFTGILSFLGVHYLVSRRFIPIDLKGLSFRDMKLS